MAGVLNKEVMMVVFVTNVVVVVAVIFVGIVV